MVKPVIKVAVVGHGNLGRYHVDKACEIEDAELVGVVDIDEKARKLSLQRHPDVPVYSHYSQILDKVDAVVVVTPISTHYELTKIFLEAGKHVFCEKSLATSEQEAKTLHEIAKSKNLLLQVGHSERFHAVWKIIPANSPFFKRDSIIKINRMGPFRGRDIDVSVVEDLMIHDVDLLNYLYNETPSSVMATGYKIRSNQWDYVCADLFYSSGKRATLTASKNHVKTVREMEISNDEGTFHLDLVELVMSFASNYATLPDVVEKHPYRKQDHLLIEQRHFYDSILNKKPPVVSSLDAIRAIKVLDAINLSMQTKNRVEIKTT